MNTIDTIQLLKLNATQTTKFNCCPHWKYLQAKTDLGWLENIVGKGENAGYQYFLLFQQCFLKAYLSQL